MLHRLFVDHLPQNQNWRARASKAKISQNCRRIQLRRMIFNDNKVEGFVFQPLPSFPLVPGYFCVDARVLKHVLQCDKKICIRIKNEHSA